MFMKMQILCLTLSFAAWTLVSASPLPADSSAYSAAQATLIRYENVNDGSGNYRFGFETSDGTKRDETGILVNAGQPDAHVVVAGSYTYRRPDGKYEVVSYSADENGYITVNAPVIKEDMPLEEPVVQALPNAVVASLLG